MGEGRFGGLGVVEGDDEEVVFGRKVRTKAIVDGGDTEDESSAVDVEVEGECGVAGFIGWRNPDSVGKGGVDGIGL